MAEEAEGEEEAGEDGVAEEEGEMRHLRNGVLRYLRWWGASWYYANIIQ